MDVIGIASAAAVADIDSSPVGYRRGEFFHGLVSVSNSGDSTYPLVTVTASSGGTNATRTGSVYVPEDPELFSYDDDGNLESDGRWDYTWDGENRLIRLVANTTNGPQQRIDFEYEARGRRIWRSDSHFAPLEGLDPGGARCSDDLGR